MHTLQANVPEGHELSVAEVAPQIPSGSRGPMRHVRKNYAVNVSLSARSAAMGRSKRFDNFIVHTQTASLFFPRGRRTSRLILSSDGTPKNFDQMAAGYSHSVGSRSDAAKDALWRRTFRRSDHIIAFSTWAARSFIEDYDVPEDCVSVIAPGTRVPERSALPSRSGGADPRILFIGGDFERKGGDLLVEAVSRISDVHLDVITNSDVAPSGRVSVHRNLRPEDSYFRKLLCSATLMALPTRADMFSLASLEAMAAGLPVITTAVGGIPDIVEDGVNGFLVEPGELESLTQALLAILDNPDLASSMGEASYRRASERFDAVKQTAKVFRLVESLHP